ncbi:MAG: DUF456 domain-containing protein [Gemmatimonadaceae bacterium]
MIELLVLAVVLFLSFIMIPFGLPGLWIMVGSALAYQLLVPGTVSTTTVVGTAALAFVAEVLEFSLAGRYARKYGGSRRAGWGAIIGGIIGAIVGVPIPIVGSIIGGFVGAFAGAFVAERSRGTTAASSTRVATGALIGRVVAAALKTGVGIVIAIWVLVAALA